MRYVSLRSMRYTRTCVRVRYDMHSLSRAEGTFRAFGISHPKGIYRAFRQECISLLRLRRNIQRGGSFFGFWKRGLFSFCETLFDLFFEGVGPPWCSDIFAAQMRYVSLRSMRYTRTCVRVRYDMHSLSRAEGTFRAFGISHPKGIYRAFRQECISLLRLRRNIPG